MSPDHPTQLRATRRIVFHGLGALGVAAALAGCAGSDDSTDEKLAAGTELTTTDQVPVQGGVVLIDQKVVVTQPTAGQFKAFTAICTHQGLLVGEVENGVIHCDNHGSEFDFSTGAVTQGPATQPLAEVDIQVKGDKILTL